MVIKNALPEVRKGRTIHFVTNFDEDGMMVSYACGPIGKHSRGTLEPKNVSCLSCQKTKVFKEAIKDAD